mmetsp:Transcript_27792/g.23343  ORF Transcript_27792/g.23343 Transcript_27792/m.23343 type:complete len:156 (+) Transcript_27792:224-691(+)
MYLTQFNDLFQDGNQIKETTRRASGLISNIHVQNCGQSERRRGSLTLQHLDDTLSVKVEKSVFKDSDSYSVLLLGSKNIEFDDNIIINSVKSGFWMQDSHSCDIKNNIVINTNKRLLKSVKITEINASFCICCETEHAPCTSLKIENNIGSGSDE